jgi:CHASE2 domain-containing sensor protein
VTLPRGVRSAGVALISAALVVLVFTVLADNPLIRGLETASLDLRFRLRWVRPPESEVVVILVDDRSLETLGRWPFSRAVFARALAMLDQAGAKVVAFDFLFTEPDEPVPAELSEAARAAAEALAGERSEGLRAALEKLADSGRDNRFAAAIQASGHVLLPIGLSFVDTPGEKPRLALAIGLRAVREERALAGFPVASQIGGSADRDPWRRCRRARPRHDCL